MLRTSLIASIMVFAGAAYAEDVIVHKEVVEPAPVVVEHHNSTDCSTKTVHSESEEGSKTVTKTNCD